MGVPEQLTIDEERLTWHEWFIQLPIDPGDDQREPEVLPVPRHTGETLPEAA